MQKMSVQHFCRFKKGNDDDMKTHFGNIWRAKHECIFWCLINVLESFDRSIDVRGFCFLFFLLRLMSQSMRDLLQCDVICAHNINFSSWKSQNEAQEPIITNLSQMIIVIRRADLLNILKYFSQRESQMLWRCTAKLLERHLNLCLAEFDSILFGDRDVT